MEKKDYLVKTFSRTKRKDYENYILTAIWHKLDNMELKPVSQQYVRRSENNYALMDLYFPQINVGIEVDEAHHINNTHFDELRMNDIISAINVNDESEFEFHCIRIDATRSIDEINNRINDAVEIINNRISLTTLIWKSYEEQLLELQNKKYLSVNDDMSFKYIRDIMNSIFARNAIHYQMSYFRVKENMYIYCPKLTKNVDGELVSSAAGWYNLLAEDWSYLDESNENTEIVRKRSMNIDAEVRANKLNITFAKFKNKLGQDRYRFIGIFKCVGLSPDNPDFIRYERVDYKIEIVNPESVVRVN